MTDALLPTRLSAMARRDLRILYIAKHVFWNGDLHPEDGNHAVYHREMRDTLEGLGLNLRLANDYSTLFQDVDADFVFPMLNRGGFFNSEMLLPLLCTRMGLPFLGASPILRGLSDDKHLTKAEAVRVGVPTMPWRVFRRGAHVDPTLCPAASRWVIKPNNSSASWGIGDATDHAGIGEAVARIHAEGHDAIVEPFFAGSDVEVPVITVEGRPHILPMMIFRQADPDHLRTYSEKRDLVDRAQKYSLDYFTDAGVVEKISAMTNRLIEIFWPFDFGRFEFRLNEASADVQFLEVNLNCNLWSQKVFGRAAVAAGLNQSDLIETILAESLIRHGLMQRVSASAAA
ncbi:MAG: phosphoribosylglycinamide synthetase [Sphingopyxis sp.]|nr:phosphoribosylglycinamide synthetase [Sphingopyxis sp.]